MELTTNCNWSWNHRSAGHKISSNGWWLVGFAGLLLVREGRREKPWLVAVVELGCGGSFASVVAGQRAAWPYWLQWVASVAHGEGLKGTC